MPNKQSRKQSKQTRALSKGVMVNAWGGATPKTELKWFSNQFVNQQLYHNVGTAMNNTTNILDGIVAGVSVNQRIGTSIFLKGLIVKAVFNNKNDRPNVSYRCVVVAAPSTTSADTYTELFAGGWFASVHMPSNSELLHDVMFPANQGSEPNTGSFPTKERSFTHCFEIPINKPVQYNTDGLCMTRLTVYFICAEQYSTLSTDNIASVAQCGYRLDFVDP